ncbi:MAG: cytochrome c oxidase subunit II [Proteobacteria bacterium]|nr:cytochrome c oxidase subunit II [Pseudomonadota bacterium]
MRRLKNAILSSAFGLALAGGLGGLPALAGVGQPSPWQLGLQGAATDISEQIHAFHDGVNTVIIAIAVFVLLLLLVVMVRFNEKANPTPSKTTHHTGLEVAWTIIPVFILVGIAVPSFKLLFAEYTYPTADVTLKATGHQWFWSYQYPDFGDNVKFDSVMLKDVDDAGKPVNERQPLIDKGIPAPRLLAVDNEVIMPVGKVVHVLVTSDDVIHNWTVPSFGSKVDAVPGRTTATWFRANREGIFYGQCSELCGKDHAFMPIAVRVVKPEVFAQWVDLLKNKQKKQARELIQKIAIEQAQKVAAETKPLAVAGR